MPVITVLKINPSVPSNKQIALAASVNPNIAAMDRHPTSTSVNHLLHSPNKGSATPHSESNPYQRLRDRHFLSVTYSPLESSQVATLMEGKPLVIAFTRTANTNAAKMKTPFIASRVSTGIDASTCLHNRERSHFQQGTSIFNTKPLRTEQPPSCNLSRFRPRNALMPRLHYDTSTV